MVVLDLHCNNISGQIPPSISYMDGMKFLDLSNNNFCGTIPHCFGRMNNHLLVLNLRKNSLSGIMPQSLVEQCTLEIINLNGNWFEGSLPRFLSNCMQLEVLNLGNNQLMDSFPFRMGHLQSPQILILRSNMFYGSIERETIVAIFHKCRSWTFLLMVLQVNYLGNSSKTRKQ